MTFKTKRFACSAFDATLIVTAMIDCPSDTTQPPLKALEYLSETSLCCERFVRDRLFSELESEYRQSYASARSRFVPFHYVFRIVETFSDECKSSYLLKASLLRSGQVVASGATSVLFSEGLAVPPRSLLRKRIPAGGIVLLDGGGSPAVIAERDLFASDNPFK